MYRTIGPIGACVGLLLVFGCAPKQKTVATVSPPEIRVTRAAPALPPGASPGMMIPSQFADGSFATPNRALSPAGTIWHLRAGLNVAALACRGGDEAAIIARYNALLTVQKTPLASAQSRYAAEFRAGGGDWQDRYDDQMTRLYNFFSLSPARRGFCAAADRILAASEGLRADQIERFAEDRLPELEKPFNDFFRAYVAWRRGSMEAVKLEPRPAVIAINQSPSAGAVSQPVPRRIPWLTVDPAVFR